MTQNEFMAYELDCIRQAAGRPQASVRPVECSGGIRSRTFVLEGAEGGSFIKCLDAGYHNPPHFYLTLEHEAAGYRLFAPLDDGLAAVPQVHFFQSFPGPQGQELQVLGMTNLETLGSVRAARDVYLDPAVPLERKEAIANLCGRTMARLVSANFQASLDRAAGVAALRDQTSAVFNHPQRQSILSAVENHEALPWAYQNKFIGEMNVLLPHWLELAGRQATPETRAKLDRAGRVLTSHKLLEALSPAQSSDRIIFSPHDRHDGNTLLILDGDEVQQLFEVDMEFWGLETLGRLVGRYAAIQYTTAHNNPLFRPSKTLGTHLMCLLGTFLYHFIRGEKADSPEAVLRAVSVGLAGFHAAIFRLYVAALFPPGAAASVDDALDLLHTPDTFLGLAADYAESRPDDEAEVVLETVGQVWLALRPLAELAAGLLGG